MKYGGMILIGSNRNSQRNIFASDTLFTQIGEKEGRCEYGEEALADSKSSSASVGTRQGPNNLTPQKINMLQTVARGFGLGGMLFRTT